MIPLTEERERLSREIAELKAIRDTFLEETTALNARNEELAQLSHIYSRRLEAIPEVPLKQGHVISSSSMSHPSSERPKNTGHTATQSALPIAPSLSASTSGSSTITAQEDYDRHMKYPSKSDPEFATPRKLKWIGYSKGKTAASPAVAQDPQRSKGHLEHSFQQISVLRFSRCDHCSEKLWGSQLRCSGTSGYTTLLLMLSRLLVCNSSIHVRCVAAVQTSCMQQHRDDPQAPLSKFL